MELGRGHRAVEAEEERQGRQGGRKRLSRRCLDQVKQKGIFHFRDLFKYAIRARSTHTEATLPALSSTPP